MADRDEPASDPQSLDPERPNAALLRWAYARGVFPMADPDVGSIGWYSPDPRGIIPLEGFHVPRTLARALRRTDLEIRADTAFERVMRECGRQRDDDGGTWIDERLVHAYVELHATGGAHSVEAWCSGRLVGGLYGVHLGAAFFGESMFIRPEHGGTDSSKICLVRLVQHLLARRFTLLDTQFWNPHLDQFGCTEIARDDYLLRLAHALENPATWGEFVVS
ncbi:MAG: leucyl/phenylalanyl-tRNA--protein transferase [Planctomycetes bacterium]|nr:leucyl/phenylalanyl-tRNA--protein transferase [Planctomycetota bacterium]